MTVHIVVEGDTDLPVARKLAAATGFGVGIEIDCGGKARLDRELPGYNNAARGSPWLVLRDLDDDACAPELLTSLLRRRSRWMCLRIAVREVESWLLADAAGVSRFLAVDERSVPADPDRLRDPVAALVALASRSTSGVIRRGMVPGAGDRRQVGPLYEAQLIGFGSNAWSLERACRNSPSLARARRTLRRLAGDWHRFTRGDGGQ